METIAKQPNKLTTTTTPPPNINNTINHIKLWMMIGFMAQTFFSPPLYIHQDSGIKLSMYLDHHVYIHIYI